MSFSQFLNILRARKWGGAAVPAGCGRPATTLSLLWPKSYLATSSVLVDVKGADPLTGAYAPGAPCCPATWRRRLDVLTSRTVAVRWWGKTAPDR